MNIIPDRGERALIVGQTGSGKTALAVWILSYLPGALILDTKIEPKFSRLPNSRVVEKFDHAKKAWEKDKKLRYVIFRPPVSETVDPDLLDHYLLRHYNEFRGVPVYVDEAYQFHNGSRAGQGLVSVLTRGRSRGITTILASQRPKWLSRFCITEAQKFFVMFLSDRDDRKRFAEVIPGFDADEILQRHHFQYYDYSLDSPIRFAPVGLDRIGLAGHDYTDEETTAPKRAQFI